MKINRNRIVKVPYFIIGVFLVLIISCEKNQPPIIQSIMANPTELEAGGNALLSVAADDPDGDPLIYLWEASGGEITTDNSLNSITWYAPAESGIFFCSVSVNDGTDIVQDSVQITVSEDPVLSIDKDTLLFKTNSTQENFIIANLGTGLLDWTAGFSTNDGGSWIKSITPDQGATAKDNPESVEVVVDRSGLSGGSYQGKIDISSDDKDTVVQIVLLVAEMAVSPTQLDFGAAESEKSLSVQNKGSGTLNYNVSVSDNWIIVNPNSGIITAQPEAINVQVDRAGKSPGTFTGQVIVSSDAGEVIVGIQMVVEANPILQINTDVLDFDTSLSTRSFFIQNGGGGTLSWTISESLNWIDVTPINGSTTTETDNIQVTANRSVLASGTHTGKITVNSNGGNIDITVNIEVVEQPVLKVNTGLLDFGNTINNRSFFIQNAGDGTLTWTISESLNWLNVNPASGTTTTETDNIQLIADRSVLQPGRYTGIITVNSNGGNAQLTINIQVDQGPVLKVSKTELDFGTSASSLTFSINNSGAQTLEWTVNEQLNWLTVNPGSGSTTTETDNIQVIADRTVLTTGDHSGQILVKSNGGDADINVSIQIGEAGEWLIHDDGNFEGSFTPDSTFQYFFMWFDRPSGWKEFKITKIAISFGQTITGDNIELFCATDQFVNQIHLPLTGIYRSGTLYDPNAGWNEWTVDWAMSEELFHVGYKKTMDNSPSPHYDEASTNLRGSIIDNQNKPDNVSDANWAIRVYVVKTSIEPSQGQWLEIIAKPPDGSSGSKSQGINIRKEFP